MMIKERLAAAARQLNKSGLKEPLLEAQWLLSAVLGRPRSFLLAHPEARLKKTDADRFSRLIAGRAEGRPFAYLTGHREFYGRDFLVNKNVLIPRPETELLVEEALQEIKAIRGPKNIVDVGTGSGCIIITLAEQLPAALSASSGFYGLDIYPAALKIARANARKLRAKKCRFIKSDLLAHFLKTNAKIEYLSGRPLIVAANLPYLTPRQIKAEPSIKFEPRIALSAGPDGLKYYRRLFGQIKKIAARSKTAGPNQKIFRIIILCEIDPRQSAAFRRLAASSLPGFSAQIKNDLAGLDRLVIIKNK